MSGECEECSKKKRLGLQTKLTISEPGDTYEQEADRIANQVLATPAHPAVSSTQPIRRFVGQPAGQTERAPASVEQALAGPGRQLEPTLRQDMEQRFGYDFSQVWVHSGAAAEQSARDVNARAYTVGDAIVFGAGRFAPGTHEGRQLIAHELAHVLQQSGADGIRAGQRDEERGLSPVGADIVHGAGELQGVNRLMTHELTHVAHRGLAAGPNVIRRAPGDEQERSGRDFKIVSDVWEVEGRLVVVVESGGKRTAFYKRSSSDLKGRLEGHAGPQAGDWAPFEGFRDDGRGGGYFQKDIYYAGKLASDPRYGYGEHLQTAIWLGKQTLPKPTPEHWQYVQSRLQSKGVKVRTPLQTPIPERPAPVSPPARTVSGEINVPEPSQPGRGGPPSTGPARFGPRDVVDLNAPPELHLPPGQVVDWEVSSTLAGGVLLEAKGPIMQSSAQLEGLIKFFGDQPVTIFSGYHRGPGTAVRSGARDVVEPKLPLPAGQVVGYKDDGWFKPDRSLFLRDNTRYGHLKNVTVIDGSSMTSDTVDALIQARKGVVIEATCYGACRWRVPPAGLQTPAPKRPTLAPVSPPAKTVSDEANMHGPSLPGGGGPPKAAETPAAAPSGSASPRATSEYRGAPVEPIRSPADFSTKAAVEGAAQALVSMQLGNIRGAEAAKAAARLNELLPEAEAWRTRGYGVTITLVMEVPDKVDLAARMADVGDPGQVVYFKKMYISAISSARSARIAADEPPAMRENLAPREKYPVKGTEPRPGFHLETRELQLAAPEPEAQRAPSTLYMPYEVKLYESGEREKVHRYGLGRLLGLPQHDFRGPGLLSVEMWDLTERERYTSHDLTGSNDYGGRLSGRFERGYGTDAYVIYSSMHFERDGNSLVLVEKAEGEDLHPQWSMGSKWKAKIAWRKVGG